MDLYCFLSASDPANCGVSRGCTETVCLYDCKDDIRSHLRSCHLSKENVDEYKLILARAGLFDLSDDQMCKMGICPKHRHRLGRYWLKSKTTCQYPGHVGNSKKVVGRDTFSIKMSEEVLLLYGVTVPTGSGT
ncbi:Hypothetical predicted protein [Paramuricea clavata]|uniref:Uncharacterized protein n=1 Tax=Paramuricea clavata TaxID=317549 RepID=A0A6S7G7U4_PARCT|nr:Hypothetical predicted protein [Paramuricea clavata]